MLGGAAVVSIVWVYVIFVTILWWRTRQAGIPVVLLAGAVAYHAVLVVGGAIWHTIHVGAMGAGAVVAVAVMVWMYRANPSAG